MTAELHVILAEPQGGSIVETLEWALALAKDGRLSSVGVAVVDREGYINSAWSEAPSKALLIGAVASLQFRILGALHDG